MDVCLRLALIEAGLSHPEYLALKKTGLRTPSQFAAVMARELPATLTALSWAEGSMFPFKFDKVKDWDVRALDGLEVYTFATMVAERMPLPAVKELLGHEGITTTARYAHADSATAARDPRARLSFGDGSGRVLPMGKEAAG